MPLCQPSTTLGGKTWWKNLRQDDYFILQKHKTGPPLWWAPPFRILLRESHSFLVANADNEKQINQDWDLLQLLLSHFQETKEKLLSMRRVKRGRSKKEGEAEEKEQEQEQEQEQEEQEQEEAEEEEQGANGRRKKSSRRENEKVLQDFTAFLMDQHSALKTLINPTTNSYVAFDVQQLVERAVADDLGSSLPPSSSSSSSLASSTLSFTSSDGNISQTESVQSEDNSTSSSTTTTPRTSEELQRQHSQDLLDRDREMKETWALDPRDIKTYRELFNLPPDEPFIDYYICVLGNGFGTFNNFQGYLYIWQHYVCFNPTIPIRSKLVLPFVDIMMMRKHTSLLVTDAIEIRLSNERYSFFSFIYRDPCFAILEYLWKLRHETEPIIVSGRPISQMLGHVKYPKESKEYKKLFSEVWSPDDSFVEHFSCSYHKDAIMQLRGRLYVTQNYACFSSGTLFFNKDLKVVIPFANALSVKKQNTAFIIPNALEITTTEGSYFFSGFMSRDKAVRVISSLVERAKYSKEHYIPQVMVMGASSVIGMALVKLLVQRNVKVRAITRADQRKDELESLGAEVVPLDLDRPSPDPALVQRAFRNVDRIFFLQGVTPNVVTQAKLLIPAAQKAGVSHIVKVSPLGSKNGTGRMARLHRATEREIEASGIPFTLLRLSAHMQTLIEHFSCADGTIYFPVGQAKVSWLDARDAAACAAQILCDPDISKHNKAIYELTGPCAITCDRVAQLLSASLKRSVQVFDVETAEVAKKVLPSLLGRPEWLVATTMEFYDYFRQGNGEHVTTHVFDLLGRVPHSVEEFIEAHRREFLNDRKNYFDHSEIEALHSQFSRLDQNSDGFVTLKDFQKGMGGVLSQCPPLVEGLFHAFDTNDEKKIEFSQYIHGMSILMKGSMTERLEFAFRIFDKEDKGKITWSNMERFFRSIAMVLYQYGLLDIPGLPPRRDVQVLVQKKEATEGEEDEERREEEEVQELIDLATKSLILERPTRTNKEQEEEQQTEERQGEDLKQHKAKLLRRESWAVCGSLVLKTSKPQTPPPQQEKEKEKEEDEIMKFGRGLFEKLCAFQEKLHSLPHRSQSTSLLERKTSTAISSSSSSVDGEEEAATGNEENEAKNKRNSIKEALGITLSTWKEFFAQKKEIRNVLSLGSLLEATTTAPPFLHSLPSHSADEMRQKATINPGHSSWDFVIYMLLGIRKAQESSGLAALALDSNNNTATPTVDQNETLTPPSTHPNDKNTIPTSGEQNKNKEEAVAQDSNMIQDLPRETFKTEVRHSLSASCENLSSSAPFSSGNHWYFKDYAPLVFRRLRARFGISEEEYKHALGPERVIGNLLLGNVSALDEVVNTGRSGSFLYKSMDGGRFFIKTLPPEECLFFRRILPSYYSHMMDNPDSLLIRFLGLHKMHKPRHTVYFVVMENVLLTDLPINEQYDLKGSTVNRSVLKSEEDIIDPSIAMKDNDFHRKLKLPSSCKELFVQQVKRDCKWLESHDVCDYSLLVGIHVSPPATSTATTMEEKKMLTRGLLSSILQNKETANQSLPLLKRHHRATAPPARPQQYRLSTIIPAAPVSRFRRDSGGIRAEGAARNELYFFGLIDILTVYNFKKRSEHTFKAILYDSTQISAIPPTPYRKRFIKYIRSIIE